MRSQLFVNYAPTTGLGAKIIATPAPPKPVDDWMPSGTPGVTIRTGKDGRMQTNGDALKVDKNAKPAVGSKVEAKREPPYLPEGFAEFEYHSANGKVSRFARTAAVAPRDPILARLEALDERLAGCDDMRSRLVDHRGGCTCFISPPCNACCEPLTAREADDLGWLEDDSDAAPIAAVDGAWNHGAPPSVGWFNAQDDYDRDHDAVHFVRYWDGANWRHWCGPDRSVESKRVWLERLCGKPGIQWRGPRLVGAEWPELSA